MTEVMTLKGLADLLATCAAQEATIEDLTRERDDAIRELARERESLPSPGIWLVNDSPIGWSGRWIAVADTPDPVSVAALERRRPVMAEAVRCLLDTSTATAADGLVYRVIPSAWDIVDAVIAACLEGEA